MAAAVDGSEAPSAQALLGEGFPRAARGLSRDACCRRSQALQVEPCQRDARARINAAALWIEPFNCAAQHGLWPCWYAQLHSR